MKATLMYGAGDVRTADVSDPTIHAPADAIVRVVRAAICGSDLVLSPFTYADNTCFWCRHGLQTSCPLGGRYGFDGVDGGYRAMAGRQSLKVLIDP